MPYLKSTASADFLGRPEPLGARLKFQSAVKWFQLENFVNLKLISPTNSHIPNKMALLKLREKNILFCKCKSTASADFLGRPEPLGARLKFQSAVKWFQLENFVILKLISPTNSHIPNKMALLKLRKKYLFLYISISSAFKKKKTSKQVTQLSNANLT